jgi:hypothetical protein
MKNLEIYSQWRKLDPWYNTIEDIQPGRLALRRADIYVREGRVIEREGLFKRQAIRLLEQV